MHYRLLVAASFVSAAVACTQQLESTDLTDSDQTEADRDKLDSYARDGSVFDSRPPETSGQGRLLLLPSTTYSGFDGEHSYRVPVQAQGSGDDLVLEADDPSALVITKTELESPNGDKGKWFIIEPKKTGLLGFVARSKGQTAKARVIVEAYDAARWKAGKRRYENGGGGDPACTTCHVNGRAIDHSPAAMARATDGEVSFIVSRGERPNHTPIGSTGCTDCTTGGEQHRWSATDEELAGLVTYLRGLPPHGFR